MAPAAKVLKGIVTTDGAGVGGPVSLVTTGYRVRRVRVIPMTTTGGTITVKDNNGAGATLLSVSGAAGPAVSSGDLHTAAVSPVVVSLPATGGASKQFKYEVVLQV